MRGSKVPIKGFLYFRTEVGGNGRFPQPRQMHNNHYDY